MTATQLIQKYVIEHNLTDIVECHPEIARFFDSNSKLVDASKIDEVVDLLQDYDAYRDCIVDFYFENGERIENFGMDEGSWPQYYKAFDIEGQTVAWVHQYGGGKHCEYDYYEWLEDAFFVKRTQQARIVYIYEDLRKND